jgi:hypothetical protein
LIRSGNSIHNSPSVEDVHEGDGKHVGLLGAGKVGNMGVQRNTLVARQYRSRVLAQRANRIYLLSSTSLGNSQTDTENSVGTKLGLVVSAIKLVEELVDLGLVLDIKALLDQSRTNGLVDIGDGLGDTLATPLVLLTVTELASLVLACFLKVIVCLGSGGRSGAGGRDEPVEAPDGTMARWRPVSVTMSTSTVGLPRES